MSNTVFLVKGFITKSSKEKAILYNGTSASDAFGYYNKFGIEAFIEIQIWDNGQCVQIIEKENLKEVFLIESTYFGTYEVCLTEAQALAIYKKWIDDIHDSKEMNDAEFKTKVTVSRIDNVTKQKTIILVKTIVGEEDESYEM